MSEIERKRFQLYSSNDGINFEWEGHGASYPEVLTELTRCLKVETLLIDPDVAKVERWPKHRGNTFYVFDGLNNVDGIMVGRYRIVVDRFERHPNVIVRKGL